MSSTEGGPRRRDREGRGDDGSRVGRAGDVGGPDLDVKVPALADDQGAARAGWCNEPVARPQSEPERRARLAGCFQREWLEKGVERAARDGADAWSGGTRLQH